jgi:pyruvate formate lyase activating enzyme
LLQHLKSNGIHVVLETSGYFAYDVFKQKVLPYIDIIYYDIKIASPTAHNRYTGRSNRRIFENFRRLLREEKIDVIPRIPFIPGITSTRENLLAIVDFLCEAGARCVCLLPYNPLGIDKYISLGRAKPPLSQEFVKPDDERRIYALFRAIIEERLKRVEVKI